MDELPLFRKENSSRLSGGTGRRVGRLGGEEAEEVLEPESGVGQQVLATLRAEVSESGGEGESVVDREGSGAGEGENRSGVPVSLGEPIREVAPVRGEGERAKGVGQGNEVELGGGAGLGNSVEQVRLLLPGAFVEPELDRAESLQEPQVETAPAVRIAEPIPARMLNEFVYCPRLFYYEHVEGIFVESADTLRGAAIHAKVDSGNGRLPAAKGAGAAEGGRRAKGAKGAKGEGKGAGGNGGEAVAGSAGVEGEASIDNGEERSETIHSRSVELASERLGVIAKMDLVEGQLSDDLFSLREVVPVDYKAGAPKEGEGGLTLWDTDKMQLGLQALILRDNGYVCNEGVIYYRATKQRVPLEITPELELWIEGKIAEARATMKGPIPGPLIDSPKCVRCSLAPACLPDETLLLQELAEEAGEGKRPAAPRRILTAKEETRALYLNSQGNRVGTKGEVLQVKDKETLVQEIRIRDLSHVALFGNVQISTQALHRLCDLDIPVTYFSMGGWFYGMMRGHQLKNIFLRMEQFRKACDPAACLRVARQFVHGKIRNHRTLLMRNHLQAPEAAVLRLKRAAEDALAARSLEQLLGIEGAAASVYFEHLPGMIKVDAVLDSPTNGQVARGAPLLHSFNFKTRNRRPPTDPVNALLSLAYSLLSKDCTLACLAVGMDPYVGFYHQPRCGRPALALDLMEEFRPLVAESAVLTAINNRIVTETDFVQAGAAVNLSEAGRKRFFAVYETRLAAIFTHPVFDYKVCYRRALELQARLLGKALKGEIPEYVPLLTR